MTPSQPPPAVATTILDLDVEAHRLILEHLPAPAVACLGSTCRRLRDAAFGGPYGEGLWRRLATAAVGGPAAAALHAAAWGRAGGTNLAAGLAADVGGGGGGGGGECGRLASTPPLRHAPGFAPRAGALAWARLAAAAGRGGGGPALLPSIHWSADAAAALSGGGGDGTSSPALAACAARSGHAAVATPSGRILVTGGVRRDGGTSGGLDVVVVDVLGAAVAAAAATSTPPPAARPAFLTTAIPVTRTPLGRFRHVAVLLDTRTCPAAAAALADAGAPRGAAEQAALGDALLVHGGADAAGREHGSGGVVEVAWVSRGSCVRASSGAGAGGLAALPPGPAASDPPTVVWASLTPAGRPPAPRYHHTADAFTDGDTGRHCVVLFGGDGAGVGPEEEEEGALPGGKGGGSGGASSSGSGGGGPPLGVKPPAAAPSPPPGPPPPLVHILDLEALAWRRRRTIPAPPPPPPPPPLAADGEGDGKPTHGARHRPPRGPARHPGARALHLSAVREVGLGPAPSPQLVIVGGYAGGGLAPMTPWALDLASLAWQRGGGESPAAAALPAPRQRAAAWRAAPDWLVLYGGSPAAGGFLGDVWGLHLPSLTWAAPGGAPAAEARDGAQRPPPRPLAPALAGPRVAGRPAGPRRVAGHTLAGGLALGGCVPTLVGVVPVAKCDALLVGPPPRAGRRAQVPATLAPPPAPPPLRPTAEQLRLLLFPLLPAVTARLRAAWAWAVTAAKNGSSSGARPARLPATRAPPAGGVLAGEAAEAAEWTPLDGDGLTPLDDEEEDGGRGAGACAVQ